MEHLTAADLLSAPAHQGNRPLVMTVARQSPPWPQSEPDFIDNHPRFRKLNDYLVSRAPGDGLPGRQHIDPTDIPDLLSAIAFVDVERETGDTRLRFRLVGTICTEAFGFDLTGMYIDGNHATQCGEAIVDQMMQIIEHRQPGFGDLSVSLAGREHAGYQRVYFPLARDGSEVDMLIGVHAFHFETSRRRGLF